MNRPYTTIHLSAEVSNSDPDTTVITTANLHDDKWVFIQKGLICVIEPAQGGGGIFELRNEEGDDTLVKMDVNSVKEIPLDFGDPGLRLSTQGSGLQAMLYGAGSKQATVFVSLVAAQARRAD